MRTIAEMLRWRARRHPSLMAVWYEGKFRTYGELNESSSQLAGGMVAGLRLKPGDRVAILDKNCFAYLELFFASIRPASWPHRSTGG
jgi:long-chain acyl-CoA synthetase